MPSSLTLVVETLSVGAARTASDPWAWTAPMHIRPIRPRIVLILLFINLEFFLLNGFIDDGGFQFSDIVHPPFVEDQLANVRFHVFKGGRVVDFQDVIDHPQIYIQGILQLEKL